MRFAIPGEPCGKGRPRYATVNGHARVYTPKNTADYEKQVEEIYRSLGGEMLEGPVSIRVIAYFKIPKNVSMKTRDMMSRGEIRPTKKPDADNILKIVMDGLNGVAYADDSQVTSVMFQKKYIGTSPYVDVEIQALGS